MTRDQVQNAVDKLVLAYKPKPKSVAAKKRTRKAKRDAKGVSRE